MIQIYIGCFQRVISNHITIRFILIMTTWTNKTLAIIGGLTPEGNGS